MQISHLPSIDRDRIGENRPEDAKDIRVSNCPEFQAKIALSKIWDTSSNINQQFRNS